MDDDIFVFPPNLKSLNSEYGAQHPRMIGQSTCSKDFCGETGYVISKTLFNQFSSFIKECHPTWWVFQSDQFVP